MTSSMLLNKTTFNFQKISIYQMRNYYYQKVKQRKIYKLAVATIIEDEPFDEYIINL